MKCLHEEKTRILCCCREIISRYAQAINELANDIAQKVAEGLGVTCYSFEGWPCQFRINKYSFTEESVGSYGVQVHTDSGFLTILQEDENVGGLEIMDKSGGGVFFAIDPSPGSLLVNLGDVATVSSIILHTCPILTMGILILDS